MPKKVVKENFSGQRETKCRKAGHQYYFASFKGIISNNGRKTFHVTELMASGKAVGTPGKLAVPLSVLLRWGHNPLLLT